MSKMSFQNQFDPIGRQKLVYMSLILDTLDSIQQKLKTNLYCNFIANNVKKLISIKIKTHSNHYIKIKSH